VFGRNFIVENRAGAGGGVGAEPVYHSEPDGYTLMVSQPSVLTTNTALYAKLNYDPAGFEPISMLADVPNVLLVRPNFPAKTAKEFVEYAKAHRGKLNYGSQGIGSRAHLTAELFDARAGTKLVHVPYKGSAPALNDLIAGHIDLIFMELPSALRLHEAGKAHILAVTANKRLSMLPDVLTMEEAGVPLESTTWTAMSGPPKTPKAIIAKLNSAINEELRTSELKAQYAKLVTDPAESSPESLRAFIKQETKLWGDLIRAAKIQPE
jgi:tripartite-type tricarboxylate transporter receptor subunit TctC